MEPYKQNWVWKDVCQKEMDAWVKNFFEPSLVSGPVGNKQEGSTFFRVPVPGEPVTLSGMRHRPELNGVAGEVVSSKQDEFGRITVKVFDALEGERKMKIQPFRLVPSSSSPFAADRSDAGSSVRSVSRHGSQASVGARSLASVISISAQSALSNTGSSVKKLRAGTPVLKSISRAGSSPAL
eukprot:gb/GFBE01006879.1/.p1 GENE.gb/GFBE01006879.1/~~gb/GFBE01006879.1/.p1  ORF type:complete len:182 (+),score=34.77 gb/GFBE01006879.1/:1-546(+)